MKTSIVMLSTPPSVCAAGGRPFTSLRRNGPQALSSASVDFAAPTTTGGDASNDVCRPCTQNAPLPGMQCVAAACACVNQNCCCR